TMAAILGMVPLAVGLGAGSEMYTPLATAVIGGLITSTILTLYVVPTVYTIIDDIAHGGGLTMKKDRPVELAESERPVPPDTAAAQV
ncbi:efflux RND transporter permease subunit, partial [Acinetobacter baumannii]